MHDNFYRRAAVLSFPAHHGHDKRYFMDISARLMAIRLNQKRSLVSLAKLSDLSTPTVRSVEAGTANISSMMQYAHTLGVVFSCGKRDVTSIGAFLADERHSRGINQRSFAKLTGVTQPTIIAMERRDKGRMITLHKALQVLNVELAIQDSKNLHIRLGWCRQRMMLSLTGCLSK